MTEPYVCILMAPLRGFRCLYDWTLRWSRTPRAIYALFAVAFAESSFFPIPPDALLIPMTVAERRHWWRNATICTIGSVLGGVLGYAIGWGLYETAARPLVEFYNLSAAIELVEQKYAANAFLAVFGAAFTPIPYKAFTIAAGLFSIPLPVLIIASLAGRAGRFFAVALALAIWGARISDSIEKHFNLFSVLFLVLLIAGFVAMKHF